MNANGTSVDGSHNGSSFGRARRLLWRGGDGGGGRIVAIEGNGANMRLKTSPDGAGGGAEGTRTRRRKCGRRKVIVHGQLSDGCDPKLLEFVFATLNFKIQIMYLTTFPNQDQIELLFFDFLLTQPNFNIDQLALHLLSPLFQSTSTSRSRDRG